MIIGLGSDIVDVRRIARVIARHGDRFIDRIFTPLERAKAEGRANKVETYAKRFAAKEACAKALGTGLRRGVFWRDMGVVNMPGGRPDDETDRRRLQPAHGDYARRQRGKDRLQPHRRRSDRAGDRRHIRGAGNRACNQLTPRSAIQPTAYTARCEVLDCAPLSAPATSSPGRFA